MIGLLFISFIIILIEILVIGMCFSKILLNIEECHLSYNDDNRKRMNVKKLKVNIKVYIFRKIRILNIKIYKDYCEIFKIKLNLNVLKKLKDDDQSGTMYVIKNFGKLKPNFENVNLQIDIGTEDVILTSFLVPTVSTIISILISKYMKENNNLKVEEEANCNLQIMPIFSKTNILILEGTGQVSFDTFSTLFFIKKHRQMKA